MTRIAGVGFVRWTLGMVAVAGICLTLFPWASSAEELPLRAGTVVSVQKDEVWTTIQAKDAEGKTFWVWTGICIVGEGGRVEILKAKHYDKMQFKSTGQVAEDCYVADLVRINGEEVRSMGAHGLPPGCVVL